MDIIGIVAALAPDHVFHVPHTVLESGADVQVQCGCSVRLTFLGVEIAKLDPIQKAEIAFQVGTRSEVSPPAVEPTVRKGKVPDGT